MKAKSDQTTPTTAEKQKVGKSYDFLDIIKPFDFVDLYKTAAETNKILEKYKTDESISNKETTTTKLKSPKRERLLHKINKKNKQELLDVSQINIDSSTLISGKGACAKLNNTQLTSTPNTSVRNQGAKVKSIMKNASFEDQRLDSPGSTTSTNKPKKRNKSVSFMLDDTEELVVKRTKSDDLINANKMTEHAKSYSKDNKKTPKKLKIDQQSEKENTATEVNKQKMDVDSSPVNVPETNQTKGPKPRQPSETVSGSSSSYAESPSSERKKKIKKVKKELKIETNEAESNNNEVTPETKTKRLKKKKQLKYASANKTESGDGDDEPATKSRKTDPNPDIAEDLENLSIGDNAHTLTNMLDEMTVVDKEKRKKLKKNFNKNKKPKSPTKEESEKSDDVKERVKWKKRKWNKDKKGDINNESLETTVIVENLPISIIYNYKKLLMDYFIKYGLIKKVGMAEVYPTEVSKPVFTTTIIFNSDGAAEKALGDNNTIFEGSRIRVRRPLPATATTIVVRSYAELTDQNISTTFHGMGKIRSIRHLVKGKKSMATTFVEFDGPEAVERAISKMTDFKIGGKKVHVAKFEPRRKKKKEMKPKNEDSAADADSEDSND